MSKKKLSKETISETSSNPERKTFYRWDGNTLILNILGKPNSKQDAIGKVIGNQLKINIAATPQSGKATEHLVKFLSKVFDVPKSDIEIVFGTLSVNKQFRIKNPGRLPREIMR